MIKTIKSCAISIALTVVVGCESDITSEHYNAVCNLAEIVKKVADQKGMIMLDSTSNVFKMFSGINGSYDLQDVGVICNLPEQFKKNDIEVIFSGAYYKYDGEVKNKIPGQRFYYLELNHIKALE